MPALVNRGHALAGLGRIDDAIASYEAALEEGSDATFHDEAMKALEKLTGEKPAISEPPDVRRISRDSR